MNLVWFHEEACTAKVGGKGQSLCRMWQAGLPVPAGFCITADAIDRFDLLEAAPYRACASLLEAAPYRACASLQQLERALTALGTRHVAVRSSATLEDAPAASFAGIYATRLNVVGAENVAEALREIRRSAFAPAARRYLQRHNVAECSDMAAVVQRFIAAEVSGVISTGDILNVEGAWGLGESIVAGLVSPDRWMFSRNRGMISSNVADKDIAVVASENGGTKQIKVHPEQRRRPCLTSDSLQQLFELALKCHELFGIAQDIEWAIESNRVWILQSRPITGSKR